MRLLFDECVPRPLRRDLADYDVRTVGELGWASKRNGDLLRLMREAQFEVLITVDQNLEFQQHVSGSGISVIVLVAPTNRLKELQPLIPSLRTALGNVTPGQVVRVGGSEND